MNPDRMYDLVAVVIHCGSGPNRGHYISIVKSCGFWLIFDDDIVDVSIFRPYTPARTLSISGLKSRVLKLSFLSLKMMVKSGLDRAPSELLLPSAKISAQNGRIGLAA